MTTQTITAVNFNALCIANQQLAKEYLALQEQARVIREEVDAIYQPIFDKYGFTDEEARAIADSDHLYLCNDDDLVAQCYAEYEEAIAANFDIARGYCPALVAEQEARRKGGEIADLMAGFMGIDASGHLEFRNRMINSFLAGVAAIKQ